MIKLIKLSQSTPLLLIVIISLSLSTVQAYCSGCYLGCCDKYGDCASSNRYCAYGKQCYYCEKNGDCLTFSECNDTVNITGIIIGIIAGVIAIGLLLFFIYRYRQRQRIRKLQQNHLNQQLNNINNNNTSNNNISNNAIAIGYAITTTPQTNQQQQQYNNNVVNGQYINQQNYANQIPPQQYQCTVPTGVPLYPQQQLYPQQINQIPLYQQQQQYYQQPVQGQPIQNNNNNLQAQKLDFNASINNQLL